MSLAHNKIWPIRESDSERIQSRYEKSAGTATSAREPLTKLVCLEKTIGEKAMCVLQNTLFNLTGDLKQAQSWPAQPQPRPLP